MEKFAIQAEETIDDQRNLYIQEAVKNSDKEKMHMVNCQLLRGPIAESIHGVSISNSAFGGIDCERPRMENQESYLSQEVLRRDSLHHQRVVHLQKQLNEASKECQEETMVSVSLRMNTTMKERIWISLYLSLRVRVKPNFQSRRQRFYSVCLLLPSTVYGWSFFSDCLDLSARVREGEGIAHLSSRRATNHTLTPRKTRLSKNKTVSFGRNNNVAKTN